jgi:hypothetical protein
MNVTLAFLTGSSVSAALVSERFTVSVQGGKSILQQLRPNFIG